MWKVLITTYDERDEILVDRYCFFVADAKRFNSEELARRKMVKMAEVLEVRADIFLIDPNGEEVAWDRVTDSLLCA